MNRIKVSTIKIDDCFTEKRIALVIRTYEDIAIGMEYPLKRSVEKYRTFLYNHSQWTRSDSSVRIGGRILSTQHTSTFVYVFSFPACEAGDWERRERNRWRERRGRRRRRIAHLAFDAKCSNAEFSRADWFHGKNSAPIWVYLLFAGERSKRKKRSSLFAQRREISSIHPYNCIKSDSMRIELFSINWNLF